MQKSFWWWQCSDRYIISLSPPLHTPFSPSLISLMVSVDVKHHVYLLQFHWPFLFRVPAWLRCTRQGVTVPKQVRASHPTVTRLLPNLTESLMRLEPLTPQTDLHALGPSSNTDGIQLAVSAWEDGDVRDRRRQKNNAFRNPYRMCISLQTQSGRVRRCWQSYLEQKEWKELATKSEQWNGKHRLECVSGWHPPSKTPVGVLPWTCRIERKWPSR